MLIRVVLFVSLLSILINNIKCAEILVIFHMPLKSLHLGGIALSEILVQKKHNVTYVSAFDISPPPNNFRHVYISEIASDSAAADFNYFDLNMISYFQAYFNEFIGIDPAKATLRNPELNQLLETKKFDLVMMELLYSESLLYIAEYLKVPLLLYSSLDASYFINSAFGNFAPPSFVPHILTDYSEDMTFFQRVDNMLVSLTAYVMRNAIGMPIQDKITKSVFPEAPNVEEYYNKASVILINSDPSITHPVPLIPGMIEIGGFHVKPAKPLPKDLEDILRNSKHGVIYFSLGSILKSGQMPKETMKNLLAVFSKLKQTILWKGEAEEMPEMPSNIVIRKWLPQNDILGHKNVKLFITHGGMHSLQESVYHGVPSVILPVFFDQKRNAQRAQTCGFAEVINFEDLNAKNFGWAVDQVLNNPLYTEAAKKRSSILLDKPLSQADTLAFWVDYVIRHQGADHLKIASLKLSWYQYFLLDVLLFIVIILISLIVIIKYLLRVFLFKGQTNKLKTS